MTDESLLVFSGIAPHPPIMVPEVGREAIAEVRGSIDAMADLTRRLIASRAETVVLISPHAPLDVDSFVAYEGPELYGDFSNFRAPETQLRVSLDDELLRAIAKSAAHENFSVVTIMENGLDHGTSVPLYFLLQNGWHGQVVALGYSFLSNEDHLRFGACIRRAIDQVGRRVAVIASGDLSHRLRPQAPAGFNPSAYIFDEEVVDALRCNEPERIVEIDPSLRALAGECGYRSILVAIGAGRQLPLACEVINYEAPFGVGYLVAQLTNQSNGDDRSLDSAEEHNQSNTGDLPGLARHAVEMFVSEGLSLEPPSNLVGLLAARAPCFVSLKTFEGDLRGCIGTIEPDKDTLAEEIIANAISAATRDPRFPPVTGDELATLRFSVDVLFPAEPVSLADLDPAVYGVIVEDESGLRRGLLLPDIPGIDRAEQQVEIAARKAGISAGTPLKLSRFRVERFREAVQCGD
jgi:AmmeMemoRadiSam system protein A/AmmeMemoRadiSam system protein B